MHAFKFHRPARTSVDDGSGDSGIFFCVGCRQREFSASTKLSSGTSLALVLAGILVSYLL